MRVSPLVIANLLCCAFRSLAEDKSLAKAIDAYVRPYVESGNFATAVLVEIDGKIVFEKAYGMPIGNVVYGTLQERDSTSLPSRCSSLQPRSCGSPMLVRLALMNTRQSRSSIEGAERISIRNLLTERSGLPDINAFPDYNDVLQHPQTPSSLVAKIRGRSLLFEPGSKFLHEEHSAYNLLALIVGRKLASRLRLPPTTWSSGQCS
jgi:hypothetical protein